MNRLVYNRFTTTKVEFFHTKMYSIRFNPGWRRIRKIRNPYILDFINLKNDIGILQISAFSHPNEDYEFGLNESLNEILQKGYKAHIMDIGQYKSIVYALKYENDNLYQYRFELGYKNSRLFITLTFGIEDNIIAENNFQNVIKILNTIRFLM